MSGKYLGEGPRLLRTEEKNLRANTTNANTDFGRQAGSPGIGVGGGGGGGFTLRVILLCPLTNPPVGMFVGKSVGKPPQRPSRCGIGGRIPEPHF